MITVTHVVRVAYLVEAHRGQLILPVVRAVYAAPPVAHAHLERQERFVEVPISSYASLYLLDLDGPHPSVDVGPAFQGAFSLLEREQGASVSAIPPQPFPQAVQGSLQEGAIEVPCDLLFDAD